MNDFLTKEDIKRLSGLGQELKPISGEVISIKNTKTGEVLTGPENEVWEKAYNKGGEWKVTEETEKSFWGNIGEAFSNNQEQIINAGEKFLVSKYGKPKDDDIHNYAKGAQIGTGIGIKNGIFIGGITALVGLGVWFYVKKK